MASEEFAKDEWVTIWSGRHEGLSSIVKDVRMASGQQECLTSYGWQPTSNLVRSDDKRLRRYDAQGYCDNPSRGF